MKQITKLLINEFKIKELGYDFMGYSLQKGEIYNYHHLIVPRRHGGLENRWNGAILCSKSSHPYLHLIEAKDYDLFCCIQSGMIDENMKGYLDIKNIREIHNLLNLFEREHCGDRSCKGRLLIKEEYIRRRIQL